MQAQRTWLIRTRWCAPLMKEVGHSFEQGGHSDLHIQRPSAPDMPATLSISS